MDKNRIDPRDQPKPGSMQEQKTNEDYNKKQPSPKDPNEKNQNQHHYDEDLEGDNKPEIPAVKRKRNNPEIQNPNQERL